MSPATAQPSPVVRLTMDDFALFSRHPISVPWNQIPPGDQEAYRELRQRLKSISESIVQHYPSKTQMKAFQSHPAPNGRNPLESWCCIFPDRVANKSFALQYALIVSQVGVEICFCLGSGTAQGGSQSLTQLQTEFMRMKSALSLSNATAVAALDETLRTSGWQFRSSWREPPGSKDFDSLQDWLKFACSLGSTAASISRNLSPADTEQLGDGLVAQFQKWGEPFASLFDIAYPPQSPASTQAPGVVATPSPAAVLDFKPGTQEQRVWLIAPGERARLWPEFLSNKIAAIGWEGLGDLRQYPSKQAIADKIKDVYKRDFPPTNDATACFEFSQVMQPGDLVYAKQGTRTIVGVGIVRGPYEFRPDRQEYKHVRKVDWTAAGPWKTSDDTRLAIKTLTEITDYPDYVERLRILVSQGEPGPSPLGYSLDRFVADTGITKEVAQGWLSRLRRKKQMIFQGPPGTGKTFVAEKLALTLASEGEGFVETAQLHPATTYEDFILGIRPQVIDGQLCFQYQRGRFLSFCEEAAKVGKDSPCVLVLDEINRANLPRILGELLYLLEYRDRRIPLAGSDIELEVPPNVFIIGTMNTADRSIALVDHALRRRFTFVTLAPDYEVLRSFLVKQGLNADPLISVLKGVNAAIDNPHYEIGISFFMKDGSDLPAAMKPIWTGEIEPYLEEYFYDSPAKVGPFRWERVAEAIRPHWQI